MYGPHTVPVANEKHAVPGRSVYYEDENVVIISLPFSVITLLDSYGWWKKYFWLLDVYKNSVSFLSFTHFLSFYTFYGICYNSSANFRFPFWSPLALTEKVYSISDIEAYWLSWFQIGEELSETFWNPKNQNIFKPCKEAIGQYLGFKPNKFLSFRICLLRKQNGIVSVFRSNNKKDYFVNFILMPIRIGP